MSGLRVVRPGPRATVQDAGRPRLGHLGVPAGGMVDPVAGRAANAVVGNAADAAVLELALGGAVFVAERPLLVGVAGADAPVLVDGVAADAKTAITLAAGQELRVGPARNGVYVYLAVAGGVDVEPVLGSRGRDTLSGLGPPALEAGDVVPVGSRAVMEPGVGGEVTVVAPASLAVFPGPHLALTGAGVFQELVASAWSVTPVSDRTGLRLAGPRLGSAAPGIPSEGLVPGAIQLPPDGQPVLFLANHPVTGGYPVIAVVAHADIRQAAQSRPGAQLTFRPMG